jgi:pimeloyl-ACP methyl ester carboxylesterase
MTDTAGGSPLRVPFESVPVLARVLGPASGPAVLLAHPFPLHGACWEPQAQALASVGFRAIAVDAPGFGGSPPLGRALRMDDLAQIFALVLDHVGAPRAVLAGCSMGGYAVLAFAQQFHERLAGAALICTKAGADTPEGREKRENLALAALGKGAHVVTAQLLPSLVHEENADARRRAEELAEGATAQGIADALRGMAERPDLHASLRSWEAPALVIAGEHDKLMAAADTDELAAGVPQARKHVVAGAGHLAFLERPAEVNALLVDFVRACHAANAWSRRAAERSLVVLR